MKYLRLITITFITLTYINAHSQNINENFEHTNKGQQELKNREDSLLAYSDSLYGIGISLLRQGKNIEALDYFKQSNSIDSLNWNNHWDFSEGILSSSKSWISYILYGIGKKEDAQKVIESYDVPHSYNVTAEELYNAKPFDRRIYTFKVDSLHKAFDKDSTLTTYDKNVAEAELMKKTFGENHYLYANYLWRLGDECYNPHTALYYLNNAKRIYEQSALGKIFLEHVGKSIKDKEFVILSDSLLEKGVQYYKKEKFDEAIECFVKSFEIVPITSSQEATHVRNIDFSLLWLKNSLFRCKSNKVLPYTYAYKSVEVFRLLDGKERKAMDSLKDRAEKNYENKNYINAIKYYTALESAINAFSEKNSIEFDANRIIYRDKLMINMLKANAYQRLNKLDEAQKCLANATYFYDFTPLERSIVAPLDSLINPADTYFSDKKYGMAIKYYEKFIEAFSSKMGTDNCWYAFLKLKEANTYQKMGKIKDAINCLLIAQPLFQKTIGEFNRLNVECLGNLQDSYQLLGSTKKALKYSRQLLDVIEHMYGKGSENYLSQLVWVAFEFNEAGHKSESCTILDQVINQLNDEPKKYSNNIKFRVYDVGDYCYGLSGLSSKALKCSKQLVALTKGQVYYNSALLRSAKNLILLNRIDEAVNICNSADNKDMYFDMSYLLLLSDVYENLGENKKALNLLLWGKKQCELSSDTTSMLYITIINSIGFVCRKTGNITSAVRYYTKSADILEKLNREESVKYANCLKNLAAAFVDMGNYRKGYDCIERSLEINKQLNGEISGNYADALTTKILFLKQEGKYKKSLELLDSVFVIFREIETPFSNVVINKYYIPQIEIYYLDKKYDKVNLICDNLLSDLNKKEQDETYSDVNSTLYRYKSLAEYKLNHAEMAMDYARKALAIDRVLYGENSKICVDDETLLVTYMFLSGDSLTKACDMAQHVTDYNENYIDNRFSEMTANERTLLWNNHREWFDQKVPKFSDTNSAYDSLSKLAYNCVLYSKGILLSTEQNMSDIIETEGDEIAKSSFNQLRGLRLQLNKQYENPNEAYATPTADLERKINDLEKEISLQLKEYSSEQKQKVTWQDVKNTLGDDEAAIEFVSYTDADSIVYDAYLLKKNFFAPKVIRLVKIEASNTLNKYDVYYTSGLSKNVWGKMYNELRDIKSIYFAPTGDFYSIAIESLPLWNDSTKFVSDKWNYYRLSSTRQLVLAKPHERYTKAAVYGGLKYKIDLCDINEEADSVSTQGSNKEKEQSFYTTLDVKSLNTRAGISELPATYTEAVNIGKMLTAENIPNKLETKTAGTEESFKGMSGKRFDLLHIATHGFYWSEGNASKLKRLNFLQVNSSSENRSAEDMALTRSGLLLTGAANSILGLGLPKGAEDGVLTAGEISQLNLNGLDLVVMSACQTGLGKVSGDGVFGLQRGFKKAGANAMLMSLCKVDDNATSLLMSAFYKNLLEKGMSKHDAFVGAQKYVRDYTQIKTIDVDGDISDSDMKLMEQYGDELPEPINGKIKLAINPYKDPCFWAVFILVDGLNGNVSTGTTTNSKQNEGTHKSISAKNAPQGSFDRWSGKYRVSWAMNDEEGPYGTIEIHKDSHDNYKGTIEIAIEYDPINGTIYDGLSGTVIGKNEGMTITLVLDKIKRQKNKRRYGSSDLFKSGKCILNSGDELFSLEYKGSAKYTIEPVGKMVDVLHYDWITTEKMHDE